MELGLVAHVMLLVFGTSKLPTLARSMGSATCEFEKGRLQVDGEPRSAGDDAVAEDEAADTVPEAEPTRS